MTAIRKRKPNDSRADRTRLVNQELRDEAGRTFAPSWRHLYTVQNSFSREVRAFAKSIGVKSELLNRPYLKYRLDRPRTTASRTPAKSPSR